MRRLALPATIIVLLAVAASCGSDGSDGGSGGLLPAETFEWCKQSIAFQPPPQQWRRDRYNQGGKLGVHFTLSGGVGERIYVVEYSRVETRAEREGQVRYQLGDFIDEVRFDPAVLTEATRTHAGELVPATVGGEHAMRLDWEIDHRGHTYVGCDYYVLRNNCLFIASYMGLEKNRDVFDRLVETITFPEGS
jgi:hypothetical protein